MQWDLVLLAKLVKADNRRAIYRKLRGLGVGATLFTSLLRPVWTYIHQCDTESGTLPTEEMLRAKFPGVIFPDYPAFIRAVDEDSPEEVVRLLRERNMAAIAQEVAGKLITCAATKPEAAVDLIKDAYSDLISSMPVPMVTTVGTDIEGDMIEYAKFAEPGGAGLDFPYMELSSSGLGLNPAGIYCLFGKPGHKKTWMFIHWAVWYWMRGYRVLVLSQEMWWERLRWRAYCMRAGIDWEALKSGEADTGLLRQTIAEFGTTKKFFVRDPISSQDARPTIEGIISKFEPDVVFHDSSYLCNITVGKDAGIIRGSPFLAQEWIGWMKNTANAYRIPYFFTWQPNKEGDMYMTSAAEQDCEMILKIHSPDGEGYSELEVRKNRDGAPVGSNRIRVNSRLCEGFGSPLLDLHDVIHKTAGTQETTNKATHLSEVG